MRRFAHWTTCAAFVLPLAAAGCERHEEPEQPIPAGVSVDPPRQAPEAGGLELPGREPGDPAPVGAEEVAPVDTVTPPVQEPQSGAPLPPPGR